MEKTAFFALFIVNFAAFSIFFCTFVVPNERTRNKYKRRLIFLGTTKGHGYHQRHNRQLCFFMFQH